tara:strand:+ start:3949 stop:4827 length:879 start_codon:yes stop_codon:yes gene_type:complete
MTKTKIVNNIKYILGENDIENHQIIKESNKDHWWFHLDNLTSGHCIVMSDKINHNILIIASNFLKKYTKIRNRIKFSICYTQVKNLKILDKPGMVEIMNNINYVDHYSTNIFNASKYENGHASEYIIPNGKINITSHGIGSGIYGITRLDKSKKQYMFCLENPYILNNNDVCDNYIKASTELNEKLNNHDNTSLKVIVKDFCNIMTEFNEDYVYKKLKEFKGDYKNRKDMVMMPINYILMGLNYDGIYSRETVLDSYSKGNIKFTNYPSKKNKLPIQYFKKRNGTNEYLVKY